MDYQLSRTRRSTERMAALEAHCRTIPADREFAEPVDVFVFERRRRAGRVDLSGLRR